MGNNETLKKKIVAAFSQFVKHIKKHKRASKTRNKKCWVITKTKDESQTSHRQATEEYRRVTDEYR